MDRQMNVRVIYPGSIYDRDGAAKVVRSFAESGDLFLAYSGHNVKVFDKSLAEAESEGGESYLPDNSFSLARILKHMIKSILCTKYVLYIKNRRFIESFYYGRGRSIIEKYNRLGLNDDAFIFHDLFTCWCYVEYCRKSNCEPKKFILILHINGDPFKMIFINFPNIRGTRYHKVMNQRLDDCLRLASRIVFVSEDSTKTFKAIYPTYADKVSFVYNGIHTYIRKMLNPVFDGKIRMVTVGTVCKRKNQIILIDCLKRIRKQYDATLTIIGGGYEDCKQRAKELDVEPWVIFKGSIDDVANELMNCNLFVMSSLDEGLPIAAIEALRAKLPVVLTDVGGCKELIKGNGYLVHPNIEEISSAVIEFGKDFDKQKEMSEASYRLFNEKFTLDSMIRGYSSIIRDLL